MVFTAVLPVTLRAHDLHVKGTFPLQNYIAACFQMLIPFFFLTLCYLYAAANLHTLRMSRLLTVFRFASILKPSYKPGSQ